MNFHESTLEYPKVHKVEIPFDKRVLKFILRKTFFSECKTNSDCPDHLVCDQNHEECIEPPCSEGCGTSNTHCEASNHDSNCTCIPGYTNYSDFEGCKGEQKVRETRVVFHQV